MVLDGQGRTRWRWDGEPFGASAPQDNPSNLGALEQPLRFAGQYADQETGLFANHYRYYSPALGRYIQTDPIGLAGRVNTFAYAGGNPISNMDPLGLSWVTAVNAGAIRVQGLYYRFAPTITEFVAGASGVNGALASPSVMSPLVAQIPTGISHVTPIARGIGEAIESGAFCAAKSIAVEISNPQIPKLISGRNFQTVGSSIWGKGPKGAESVIENMTPAQAKAILDRVPAADIK